MRVLISGCQRSVRLVRRTRVGEGDELQYSVYRICEGVQVCAGILWK